jgi:hypothetical protein
MPLEQCPIWMTGCDILDMLTLNAMHNGCFTVEVRQLASTIAVEYHVPGRFHHMRFLTELASKVTWGDTL